jgi:hypothetical protein
MSECVTKNWRTLFNFIFINLKFTQFILSLFDDAEGAVVNFVGRGSSGLNILIKFN